MKIINIILQKIVSMFSLVKKPLISIPFSFYLSFLVIGLVYLLLISPYIISRFEVYEIGATADKDIISPISFLVEDVERDKLADEVTQLRSRRYYTWNRRQAFDIIRTLEEMFQLAAPIAEESGLRERQRIERLKEEIKNQHEIDINDNAAQYLIRNATNQALFSSIRSAIIDLFYHSAIVGSLQEKYTAENDLHNNLMIIVEYETEEELRQPRNFRTLKEALDMFRQTLAGRGAQSLYTLSEALFAPNMYYDAQITYLKAQEIRREIGIEKYSIGRGEILVRVGEKITEQDNHILSKLNEIIEVQKPLLNLGYFFFIIFNLIIQVFLLRFYLPDFKLTSKNLFLSSLATIFVIIIGRFFILAFPTWGKYLIMAPLATLLNFTILGNSAALILAVNGSFYYALMSDGSLQVFVTTLFSSLVIILFSNRINERKDLLIAGLASGTTYGMTIIMLNYLHTPYSMKLSYGLLGIVNGILSGSLTLVICPVFEQLFGMSTFMRLLEITNPQYELLKELKKKANGTFEHSMEVSQLIENFQDIFSINILLLKAGAIYHDIGKVIHPEYFTENQKQGDENPHDKLEPFESARIIKDHVKHSIHLAERYKLPDQVIDFIKEHHGTTRLEIFYQKALSQNPHSIINEKEFRYEGPKPQSLETGILHVADAVSAAMKSLNEVNAEVIEKLVARIIEERLQDGQFDDCSLTFKQLNLVRQSITDFYFHKYLKKRVNYEREQEKISSGNN